jgi:hypothetical protein
MWVFWYLDRDLEGLDNSCDGALLGLGDEKVHVIGHDHEAVDEEVITSTGAL